MSAYGIMVLVHSYGHRWYNIWSLYSTHADGKFADEFLICTLDHSCYSVTAS